MSTNIDVLLTIVSHRSVSVPTVASLEKLRHYPFKFRWSLGIFSGDALVSRARSIACSRFLTESKVPRMIFLDDDIVFEPQDIERLYNHLMHGYDVIGGIYAVRGASQLSSYGWKGNLSVGKGIEEVEFLATGFMGINRSVLEKIRDDLKLIVCNPDDWAKCWPFFEAMAFPGTERKRSPIYISEDWDFCEKARRVGYKIYADTDIQLGHQRDQIYTPIDVIKNQQQEVARRQVYGPTEKHQKLCTQLDTDLQEYLRQPIGKIHEQLDVCQKKMVELWTQHKGTTEDFYKDNQAYLFDLACFNNSPHYWQERMAPLLNWTKYRILDIGCGIGTTVFVMSEQGNKVVGWDINKQAIDFARFRKKKYKLGGGFVTEKPDYSKFDLILAIDVLEHIEDLRGFLLELGGKVESGTRFYHSDSFPKGEVWPMHFEEHKDKLSEYLREGGFVEWDKDWAIKP